MARHNRKPENLAELFQESYGSLAKIREKTASLANLSDIVRQICPDLPANAWQIANFRQDTVVIEAKSSVWGQRLQFERNNIGKALSEATSSQYSSIDIKVNPYGNKKTIKQEDIIVKPTKYLSESSALHIKSIAENAPKGLKEKLEKLAKHANK